MAAKKKDPENSGDIRIETGTEIDNRSLAFRPQNIKSSLVGKIISLNQKMASFCGIGSIWLTPTKYWAKIPNDMSDAEYRILANSLTRGNIVLGKKFIPPVDKKEETRNNYFSSLKVLGSSIMEETKVLFRSLLKAGSADGWTVQEIANYCIGREQKGKNRQPVILFLKEVLKAYHGPESLYPEPTEEEGTRKVIINNETKEITFIEDSEFQERARLSEIGKRTKRPEGIKMGNESVEKVLGDILD